MSSYRIHGALGQLFTRWSESVILVAYVILAISTSLAANAAENVTITPTMDSSMLVNPGKGWVQYYQSDSVYTPTTIGVGYNRWNWAQIEPKEGEFNWKIIDDFIASFKAYGRKSAIGVMSVSTGIGYEHVTPKWVFDAGAKPLEIDDNSSPTGKQIIVAKWDDPVFLAKLESFVKAFGERYDGNPDIAFIDIRDYGNWGEGHIGGLGNSVVLTPPDVLQNSYYLPYFKAFPHSQLIAVWGNSVYDKVYDWAIANGAGIRRDGILSQWSKDGSECIRAYGHAPAVFEYCDSYEDTKKKGYWRTDLLDAYIKAGKPSYLQWDPRIWEENKAYCEKVGNKIGYHFILQEASVPTKIELGTFSLNLKWLNDGICPLYEKCEVAIALLDKNDAVVQKQWLPESHPQSWLPDEPKSESFTPAFGRVDSGSYKLALGLFLNRQDTQPAYKLGIAGRTSNGWYVLENDVQVNN